MNACFHRKCTFVKVSDRCSPGAQAVFTVLPVRFARALAAALRSLLGPRAKSGTADVGGGGGLQGDQLFDLLCVLIFGATVAFLRLLPAGTIYFWLKDLTQEFLKLHVIHSAVEIFDKARICLCSTQRIGDQLCCGVRFTLNELHPTCTVRSTSDWWSRTFNTCSRHAVHVLRRLTARAAGADRLLLRGGRS